MLWNSQQSNMTLDQYWPIWSFSENSAVSPHDISTNITEILCQIQKRNILIQLSRLHDSLKSGGRIVWVLWSSSSDWMSVLSQVLRSYECPDSCGQIALLSCLGGQSLWVSWFSWSYCICVLNHVLRLYECPDSCGQIAWVSWSRWSDWVSSVLFRWSDCTSLLVQLISLHECPD